MVSFPGGKLQPRAETNGKIDRIVGGPVLEKNEDLKSNQLVGNALIGKVCDKCSCRNDVASGKEGDEVYQRESIIL